MITCWKTGIKFAALLGMLGCSLLCQGCTRQAWFEGMKARERQECDKLINDREIQQCLERVNTTKIDQ